jgi:hypothetical protein
VSDNLSADFWRTVGRPTDPSELTVGEVFLLESDGGKTRKIVKFLGFDGGDVLVVDAPDAELPDSYRVMVLRK